VRILVDYRPALRARTGVGEYIHEITRAYAARGGARVTIFSSSRRDRLDPALGAALGVATVDRRVPVRLLNLLWHRAEWPPVERLAGDADVVHAAHPLLIPARRAAQVVTVHDLYFLDAPGDGAAPEVRRDYPRLAAPHARRADAVVAVTEHVRQQVIERLGVPAAQVHVAGSGAPAWRSLGRGPHLPPDGVILCLGTLEPRKNVGARLDAYARLLDRRRAVPPLVLAGRAAPGSEGWLARITRPPLAGHVSHLGYVEDREAVYARARLLVVPSLDEGFSLPALEAMAAGIPVVATSRGALPEVVGNAGALVDPEDVDALAAAIEQAIDDGAWAERAARAGLARAAQFTWAASAARLDAAYRDAVARRQQRATRAGTA
jgi:glycosyltransferase involved in cell wall biosynthesis